MFFNVFQIMKTPHTSKIITSQVIMAKNLSKCDKLKNREGHNYQKLNPTMSNMLIYNHITQNILETAILSSFLTQFIHALFYHLKYRHEKSSLSKET